MMGHGGTLPVSGLRLSHGAPRAALPWIRSWDQDLPRDFSSEVMGTTLLVLGSSL